MIRGQRRLLLALGGIAALGLALVPLSVPAQDPIPGLPPDWGIVGPPTPTPDPRPAPNHRAVIVNLAADPAGCAALPSNVTPGSDTTWTLIGSPTRKYQVHFPARARAGEQLALVLNFHGLAADGKMQADLSNFAATADANNFIVVSPDGSGSPRGWDALLKPSGVGDDISFVRQLLQQVGRDFCVDPLRVYAAGFSNGAMFASRLGCVLGNRIAAVGAVAGVYRPQENCTRNVPVVAVHGTADDTVPFEQGTVISTVLYPGAHRAISDWAAAGSTCVPTAELFLLTPLVSREQFRGCGRNEALLYIVTNGGHNWPDEFATSDALWAFFRNQSLPPDALQRR